MSMGTGTGLSAADVAAVVDGRNGGYNDGLGIGGGSACTMKPRHNMKKMLLVCG